MTAKPKEAGDLDGLSPAVRKRVRGAELFVTERALAGHSEGMRVDSARPNADLHEGGPGRRQSPATVPCALTLAEVYEAQFDFVWRSARRLGVTSLHVDDVVQEVFLVVHRRLHEFEGRSSLRTWLFGIARRVVRDHARSARRKPTEPYGAIEPATAACDAADAQLTQLEDARLLHALLDELDADKREVFVLAELEQMSGPEIAAALDENLNTVYARLRAARSAFERAVTRHQVRARRVP
jgi:RNA polymerase sigma-70 factor, ECF subfamily